MSILLNNKTIGLVLPSVPGYSETFFRSKIAGLQKNGAKVIIFAAHKGKANEELPCVLYLAPKLNGSKIETLFNSLLILSKAFLLHFKISVHYLSLEKEEGCSLIERLKKLISNYFILKHRLDWLHFGFGTMALGRENVATVINAKMAVSFRGFDIGIYPLKHPKCYDQLFKKADKIHVISDDIAELLYRQGLNKKHIVTKITPAIDSSFFSSTISTDSKVNQFVTVGRLHWKKGFEYTLEALCMLKKNGLAFHYTIIGEGPEYERLVFASYQLGLQKNVTFAGKLSPDKVKEQLEASTIYIQYSIQEGFCNAVLEAQAMGLLCIVSDAEGLSENVLHGETGWVVTKRNPIALAEKIEEVIALAPLLQKQITLKAKQRVEEEFNIDKQTKAFVDFYSL